MNRRKMNEGIQQKHTEKFKMMNIINSISSEKEYETMSILLNGPRASDFAHPH